MDDTPVDSVRRKKRNVLRRFLLGRNRDENACLTAPEPSTSNDTVRPAAKRGSAGLKSVDSFTDDHDANDYWQMAYDELTEGDRKTLRTVLPATATKSQDTGRARTKEILDQVVWATETHYRENQRKDKIRATAYKILNAALSFQDVVSNVVKFDPTGYASSAWAIVSLGLTVWSFQHGSQMVS
jgi:hypothetical protein